MAWNTLPVVILMYEVCSRVNPVKYGALLLLLSCETVPSETGVRQKATVVESRA